MITEEQVRMAYIRWMMEENRDRGWNFDECLRLRKEYRRLRDAYEIQGEGEV